MEIGKLDKKIQIIRLVEGGRDAEGFEIPPSEEIVRQPWAQVSQTSGSEQLKSGAAFLMDKKRFLIRYSNRPINEDMFIRYAGRDYDINLINTYGDNHEYTEIWCEGRELQDGNMG